MRDGPPVNAFHQRIDVRLEQHDDVRPGRLRGQRCVELVVQVQLVIAQRKIREDLVLVKQVIRDRHRRE